MKTTFRASCEVRMRSSNSTNASSRVAGFAGMAVQPRVAERKLECGELLREVASCQARVLEGEAIVERLTYEKGLSDASPAEHGDKLGSVGVVRGDELRAFVVARDECRCWGRISAQSSSESMFMGNYTAPKGMPRRKPMGLSAGFLVHSGLSASPSSLWLTSSMTSVHDWPR